MNLRASVSGAALDQFPQFETRTNTGLLGRNNDAHTYLDIRGVPLAVLPGERDGGEQPVGVVELAALQRQEHRRHGLLGEKAKLVSILEELM